MILGLSWLKIQQSPKKGIGISDDSSSKKDEVSFLRQWQPFADRYPVTYKIARAVQILPYSTVPIERKFSQLTDIKTLKRNRLSIENLQTCLFVKQEFKDKNLSQELILAYVEKLTKQKLSLDEEKDFSEKTKAIPKEQEEIKESEILANQATQQRQPQGEEEKSENLEIEKPLLRPRRGEDFGSHVLKKPKSSFDDDFS